jgi:hypothetical protein
MNIIFEPKIDRAPASSDRSRSQSVSTEFSEARHRLMIKSGNVPSSNKVADGVRDRNRQRQGFAGSSDLVEEAFYWFLTAPALGYVVYLAFGL